MAEGKGSDSVGRMGAAAGGHARKGRAEKGEGRKVAPAPRLRHVTKAAWVRQQPLSMPARDVAENAARLGLVMTPDYVHKVRSTAKARHQLPDPHASQEESAIATSAEAGFCRLVLELGLARSHALLADIEHRLDALISS